MTPDDDLARGPATPAEAREIEEVAARSWPAEVVEDAGGWRLRAAPDRTSRANSVWPNADDGRLSVEEKIARAETFYGARGAPVRFQVCRAALPPDLDARLGARGYAAEKPTRVLAAPTATLLRYARGARDRQDLQIDVDEKLAPEWLALYARIQRFDAPLLEARRALFDRIEAPRCHVRASRRGIPVAVGVGVSERGWVGVYSLATAPDARRAGAGSAVMLAILGWAGARGASRGYLQVEADNAAALSLYGKMGFELRYGYRYRVKETGSR